MFIKLSRDLENIKDQNQTSWDNGDEKYIEWDWQEISN